MGSRSYMRSRRPTTGWLICLARRGAGARRGGPTGSRNSSLRVDSSPTRSCRSESFGGRPASVRRMPTVSLAALFQSTQKSCAAGRGTRTARGWRAAPRARTAGEQRRVEGAAEGVRRQDVEPVVADHGRRTRHGVEHHLHADRHRGRRGGDERGPGGTRGAGQVEQVLALGLVELQRAGDRLEDRVGRAREVPALEPYVVVGARRPRASRPPRDAARAPAGSRRTRSGPPAPA